MAGSDVKAKRVTGTGSVATGRARLRMLLVTTTGAGTGRLTLTDGNGGATTVDVDLVASTTHNVYVPEEGVVFSSDIFVGTATNISAVTVFWS